MPDDIREHFREAAEIVDESPRAAAVLVRLFIQRLMPHIGGKGVDLNVDIADLERKGLESEIRQAMRNRSLHPRRRLPCQLGQERDAADPTWYSR
jgi:hypothetical protein